MHTAEVRRTLTDIAHCHSETVDHDPMCTSRIGWLHRLLGKSRRSALAQVMSYMKHSAKLTLTAVSPVARLYAELVAASAAPLQLRVSITGTEPRHSLCYSTSRARSLRGGAAPALQCSVWWLKWCGLPLQAEGGEALAALREAAPQLLGTLRAIKTLPTTHGVLALTKAEVQQLEELDFYWDRVFLADARPHDLPQLRRLTVRRCTTEALAFVYALTGLTEVALWGSKGAPTFDTDRVTSAPGLRRLLVCAVRVRDFYAMQRFSALAELLLLDCRSLRSLATLAAAPRLRALTVSESDVDSVDGLDMCAALEYLDVQCCTHLKSLAGISGAPRLRVVKAARSGVTSVDDVERPGLLLVDGLGE